MPSSYPSDESFVTETRVVKGKKVKITFLPRSMLVNPAAFGEVNTLKKEIHIRIGLPKKVERFVLAHEIHHIVDTYSWGGVFGSEFRANIIPGVKDPVGLLACIWVTLSSKERVLFYLDRFRKGH